MNKSRLMAILSVIFCLAIAGISDAQSVRERLRKAREGRSAPADNGYSTDSPSASQPDLPPRLPSEEDADFMRELKALQDTSGRVVNTMLNFSNCVALPENIEQCNPYRCVASSTGYFDLQVEFSVEGYRGNSCYFQKKGSQGGRVECRLDQLLRPVVADNYRQTIMKQPAPPEPLRPAIDEGECRFFDRQDAPVDPQQQACVRRDCAHCLSGTMTFTRAGECVECVETKECYSGFLCEDGVCLEDPSVQAAPSDGSCVTTNDCAGSGKLSLCLDGRCVDVECSDDRHCPVNAVCRQYTCQPLQ